MLSPIYVHYVAEIVGLVLTKVLMGFTLDARDQNQLVLAALVVEQDPAAREAVMEKIQDKGDLMAHLWRLQCKAVHGHNAEGLAQTALDINQLMERGRKHADTGEGPGRQP